MKKVHNTTEYRDSKRVTAFTNPKTKQNIIKISKRNGLSVSKELSNTLESVYGK